MKHWSLTTLREKLIKIGAKVVWHSKYVTSRSDPGADSARVALGRVVPARRIHRDQRSIRLGSGNDPLPSCPDLDHRGRA